MLRTSVYIDGFNFYYGAVKGTPHKWLDFKALFSRVLPENCRIQRINYFTAQVSALPHDPQQPHRQKTFLAALKAHIPEIQIFRWVQREIVTAGYHAALWFTDSR